MCVLSNIYLYLFLYFPISHAHCVRMYIHPRITPYIRGSWETGKRLKTGLKGRISQERDLTRVDMLREYANPAKGHENGPFLAALGRNAGDGPDTPLGVRVLPLGGCLYWPRKDSRTTREFPQQTELFCCR